MSKQRSTQSTSGRGSQSSTARATAATTTQEQMQPGGQSTTQGVGAAEQTKQKAQELASQVQQKATQRVESGLTRGKVQAAETLNTVAQSLVMSGQQLRERNQEGISRFVDRTADRVQRVSNYLQNTDVSEMVDKTEEFARRRPALFLGGAFALGLLGARFLKSSRRQQEAGSGQWAAGSGGVRSGQGYSRGRTTAVDQEVSTPRAQEEWAAGGVTVTGGFADVADRPQTQPLSESGFGRQKTPLDYGIPPSGPEASQR
jgi:ElaB/YqjD/DUF883 family membrane-anchored ribosome-binding protein